MSEIWFTGGSNVELFEEVMHNPTPQTICQMKGHTPESMWCKNKAEVCVISVCFIIY